MRLTKSQLQFIISCDVEEIVSMLCQNYGISITQSFDTVYNSNVYSKLANTRTGLYLQSPEYIYDYLIDEIGDGSSLTSAR